MTTASELNLMVELHRSAGQKDMPAGPIAIALDAIVAIWPAGDQYTGGAWVKLQSIPNALLMDESYRMISKLLTDIRTR